MTLLPQTEPLVHRLRTLKKRTKGDQTMVNKKRSASFKTKRKLLRLLTILLMVLTITTGAGSEPQRNCCHCPPEPVLYPARQPQYDALLYELQKYWAGFALYQGQPNGLFDRTMVKAVQSFQKLHHLTVSGKIDRKTWRAIGAVTGTNSPRVGERVRKHPSGRLEILVDLNALTLTILADGRPFRSFPVAIGKLDTPSPAGSWKVVNKGYWVQGETKWLGLSVPFGVYGIHGTNQPWSIGRRASNGCIRMYNHHLEDLYDWVNPGTPVYIEGDPFRDRRELKRGEVGSDVFFLQIRLKQLGYYQKQPSGFFDYWTETALKKCQEELGLPVTGVVSSREYFRFRLYPTD